jgi:2-polyprenyl-6-hydroxyphenyl methylase/3-demethylubiquinone-9 3-methyltransferase
MNPARIQFIRDFVTRDPRHYTSTEEGQPEWTFATRHGAADVDESGEVDSAAGTGTGRWLAGKRCLDVGCGGGLLSEALTRLGGDVVGVDAGRENIAMARLHASGDPALPFTQTVQGEQVQGEVMDRIRSGRKGSLEYRHSTAEALRDAGEKFDVVCAMEVLEHVDQPGEFMKCLGDMVKVCLFSLLPRDAPRC